VALIEGLALRRAAPSIAHVHRQVVGAAVARGWAAPSYRTVHAIVSGLDRGMVTLAHDGPVRYRERFELVYRRGGRYAERDLAGRPHGA
jgi:putative transposase